MVMARQTGRHAIRRNVVGQARRAEKEVVYGLNTTSLPLVGRKGYVYDPPYHNLMQGEGALLLRRLSVPTVSTSGSMCKYTTTGNERSSESRSRPGHNNTITEESLGGKGRDGGRGNFLLSDACSVVSLRCT